MKFVKANRISPQWTPRLAASHLGLFCLPMSHKRISGLDEKAKKAMSSFCLKSTTGNRVYDGDAGLYDFSRRDGDKAATFRDYDGSVTGHHVAHVVKPWPFYTTSQCTYRQNWNMAICPHTYGKVVII